MMASLPVLDEAEVVVVGGGPGGSIAALTLAERGHDVILIDKRSFPRDKACGDGLTGSAVSFLNELGLEQALAGAQPIENVRVFVDWREREFVPMHPGSAGRPHQPCCIPRERLDHALVEMACGAGVRLVQGCVTQPLQSDASVDGVELTHGPGLFAIRARNVIAADGATSRLRRTLGRKLRRPRTFAYATRQYVSSDRVIPPSFHLYTPLPDGTTTYGYGWVFPVGKMIANVGLGYLSTSGLPHPRSINDLLDSFLTAIQESQGSLGNLKPVGRAIGGSFGGSFSAEHCQFNGVIFVGDAAQAADPITGEGIDQAMRSAHAAALGLDRAIRRHAGRVRFGDAFWRSNLRLGQDSAMIARLTHELLKRRATQRADAADLLSAPGPLLSAAAAMLTAEVAYPSLTATPAGELASQLDCKDCLAALDERLRESLSTEFPLAAELIQRESCAGLGPVAAFTLIASELACGSRPRGRSADAALCVELFCIAQAMLSRTSVANAPNASTNNALAVMIGDYSLCRALACAPDLGAEASEALGKTIEANSEGIALLARDQGRIARSIDSYIEWARLTSGATLSLAAGLGARLAGAGRTTLSAVQTAGESLGIAMQICEDVLALTRNDPVTGRRPRHILEEGHFSLPILLAIEKERHLASLLESKKDWDVAIDTIIASGSLTCAAATCSEYAESARVIVAELTGGGTQFTALCELPTRCLASL